MYALLISIFVGAAITGSCLAAHVKSGSIIFGILGFFVAYYAGGFLVRRKIKAIQTELQGIMQAGQQRMSRKIQQAQNKPGANVKLLQRQIEADQQAIYKEALQFTKRMEPFKKWSLLMGRQIATMRMQFYYQLQDFEQVDQILATRGLLKAPLLLEPMAVAMKIARQYKKEDIAGAEKTFKQRIRWFRKERGTLLYALMSWIYVKTGEAEKARQLLQKAKEDTFSETLAFNWERLSNNKEKSFSNAGLGDEWYGLYLEKPPIPKQQRVRMNPKGRRPF